MIGEELKGWRTKAGLTQAQLAERLGVTSNTVARWERDEMTIPAHVNPPVISKGPQSYIHEVMRANGLNSREVADRASRLGHRLSRTTVELMVTGKVTNPGIYTVKSLAVGLGRPEDEVFAAFGVGGGLERHSLAVSELEAIRLNYAQLPAAKQRQLEPVLRMLSREIQFLLKD